MDKQRLAIILREYLDDRLAQGLSENQAAKEIGMQPTQMKRYVEASGADSILDHTLLNVAKGLDMDPLELANDIGHTVSQKIRTESEQYRRLRFLIPRVDDVEQRLKRVEAALFPTQELWEMPVQIIVAQDLLRENGVDERTSAGIRQIQQWVASYEATLPQPIPDAFNRVIALLRGNQDPDWRALIGHVLYCLKQATGRSWNPIQLDEEYEQRSGYNAASPTSRRSAG